MKILVVGSGGREHTIVWKISQNPKVSEIYCAPGNGGISKLAKCVPIGVMDIDGMVEFSKENGIDMVIVAPDDPLAAGMVDSLQKAGIRAFGPERSAAVIEASKSFSKNLMKKYNIPTAGYEVFEDSQSAIKYLEGRKMPIVVKADGLALGKGVIIAETFEQAKNAVENIMCDKVFGEAGSRVIIEEFLVGQEVSILSFTDGETIVPMVSSQDHKRAYDNDQGPNTGGMGTFSPSRIYTDDMAKECMDKIFQPTIDAMRKEGRTFKGILYFGLMVTSEGIKVLEYNARFGDPEAQVVLPRLKTDLIEIMEAIIDERLNEVNIKWDDNAAVCVVAASGGYPKDYKKGIEIKGIDETENNKDIMVFHAGTKFEHGNFYTSGGRVLGVTALAKDLEKAREKAYEALNKIGFNGMHYRKDIGVN